MQKLFENASVFCFSILTDISISIHSLTSFYLQWNIINAYAKKTRINPSELVTMVVVLSWYLSLNNIFKIEWKRLHQMVCTIWLLKYFVFENMNFDDVERFLENGCPATDVKPYIQSGPLLEIFTITNIWHATRRI